MPMIHMQRAKKCNTVTHPRRLETETWNLKEADECLGMSQM